jgi:hypothetical protein
MKLIHAIALMLVLGCAGIGCGSNSSNNGNNGNDITGSGTQSINQDFSGTNWKLTLNNDIGNIHLNSCSGSTLGVTVKKIVKNATQKLADELIAGIQVKIRIGGNTATIETTGNKAAILEKYRNEVNIANVQFEIDYTINVPSNFSNYDIHTEMGNIALNNFANITGESTFHTNMGNISLKLSNNIKCTLLLKGDNISKTENHGGETIIHVTTDMGNIDYTFF